MASVLPIWLRLIWLCLAPLGLSFCLRIAWEETFLTWSQGRQAVGFSLAHVHPGFFEMGLFCSFGLGLWLLPAAIYMIRRRKAISWSDVVMTVLSLFAVAVIFVPESVFA